MQVKFGTAGIRGLTNTEVSPELCWRVSAAFARFLTENRGENLGDKADDGDGPTIALGHDTRPGAKYLAGICAAAMESEGAIVQNYGIAPSPLVCAMTRSKRLAGGFMVTGSHLPYDRIGLIPLEADGSILTPFNTRELERLANRLTAPDNPISGLPPEQTDGYDIFMELMRETVGGDITGISVALDPGGATGATLISRMMENLGLGVAAYWDEYSDVAPRRMEPRVTDVQKLSRFVLEQGADFGAAYDSDCDRVLFVDEKGRPLSEDLTAGIIARYFYKCGPGVCTTPVNSSCLITKIWEDRVVECRIGPPEISLSIKKLGAIFAYEESGKYFFPPKILWADGIITTAVIAKLLAEQKRPLSEIRAEFPGSVQVKKNIKDIRVRIPELMEAVKEHFRPEGSTLNDIDGLKYVFDDASWLLIRPSGTEPLLRVYTDASTSERAEELSEMGMKAALRMIKKLEGLECES